MREFLALCGYEPREIEAEFARVSEALKRVGVTERDLAVGKQRLATFFDLELVGVRKVLGVLLKEFTNTVLTRDEGYDRVAFSFMAPGCQILGAAVMQNHPGVAWLESDYTFLIVLGSIFNKAGAVLEAAEKLWLKAGGVGHCGNVKTAVGLLALGLVPKPDLVISSGFLCETSVKTVGLIQDWFGIPALYYDTWQDRELREYPYAGRATSFYAKSMRRLSEQVGERFGVTITDDMLWRVMEDRKAFANAMGRVSNLMRHGDPIPMRSTHLNLLSALESIPCRSGQLEEMTAALDTLYEELLERTTKGIGATAKGAARVLSILPCHHSDPRWEDLANQLGVAIVAIDFEFASSQGVDRAGVLDPDDPYDVIGQHMHGAAQQILGGRIALILDACRDLGLDGVLNHYHVGCRYVAGDAITIKNVVTRELGIPVLTFEWDNFDPRSYNHEQYKANMETFVGMMRARP